MLGGTKFAMNAGTYIIGIIVSAAQELGTLGTVAHHC